MGQSVRDVHEDNTDHSSDGKLIPITVAPRAVSKWEQLMGETKSNIHQPTGDMTDKTQNVIPTFFI
jgi:hypothetical protein